MMLTTKTAEARAGASVFLPLRQDEPFGPLLRITAEQQADPERLRRALDIGWAATDVGSQSLCGDPDCRCGRPDT